MRRAVLGITLALIGPMLAGCGSGGRVPGLAVGPLDEHQGSYHGVRLGMFTYMVEQRLGTALHKHYNPYFPPSAAPPDLPADNPFDKIYRDASFSFVAGRVASITVYGRGAYTVRGVALGDQLALVRELYGRVRCLTGRRGRDPEDPGCQVSLPHRTFLYFAGNPIRVMSLSSRPVIPGT